MFPRFLIFLTALALPLSCLAQIGDKAGEAQRPLIPADRIPPSPALSAEEEQKTFHVAPGFRVELVASEPLVGDPVAAVFDPDGRLWVVEMRGYMPDLDGTGEDQPVGRVVILTDTDDDGRMDRSDVFVDGLILPRAIMIAGDGALVGAPPMLWYCPDTDGDGRADEKVEVARDFGVQTDPKRPELANPERAPNALLWALDNWIYVGAYTAKFRYHQAGWERGLSTFRGQWGLSQDDWGHLFYNNNSDQLRADVIPSHYLGRNPHYLRPAGGNVKVAAEQFVWPIRVTPGINRGYRPEMLREDRLKEFTAACAPWIYRGDMYPEEFYGNAFVCEPAGNLIKRDFVTAEHGTLKAREAYAQQEFLASTDERFRPVNLTTGPDGALYLTDFYRGVIQHRISLTTYLREQSEARGLASPRGLGRIWRIVPEKAERRRTPHLAKAKSADLVKQLANPNAWHRETSQRLLVEHGDPSIAPALEELAVKGPAPLGRLHAFWTLAGLEHLTWDTALRGLADGDARVRNAVVRQSEAFLAGEHRKAVIDRLVALSRTEESAEVQLQLALTLGEARDPEADQAMVALCLRAPENPFLNSAMLTGLAGRELEMFERSLAADGKAGAAQDRLLGDLARCVLTERKADRVERMLALIEKLSPTSESRRLSLLTALTTNATTPLRRPIPLSAQPELLRPDEKTVNSKSKALLAKVNAMVTWPGKPLAPDEKPVRPLTAEERARFEAGHQLYAGICAACHQPHGLGLDGLAPPLVDSEWVLGSPERLVRIALNGVRGPIKVNGTQYILDMPAMGLFSDEQLASILTYIRREWDHGADPLTAGTIKQIRAANPRQDAWTQEELLKLP